MTKVIKREFENLGFLEINDDSFACNTQVGNLCDEFNRLSRIDNDMFTYETEIYAEAMIFINKRLVKLIDVTVEQWLNLKYENHITMDENIKKGVISSWLIRSYKLPFEEYLEIMKQRDTYARDVDMEYDPYNSARGDDEVKLSDEESSDPDDENIIDEDEVAEIFRIETNVFDFETPTCRAFKEFNYLLQIDPDVLTKDIDEFKTYEEYKDDWIYEWNEDIPWVHEKPWTYNGVWGEPTPVEHCCEPFLLKSGHSKWPTYSWKDDGYCNGGNMPGAFKVRNTLRYQDLEWYESLEDVKLKEEALLNKAIMNGTINEEEESLEET
ncbi:hypothetical protein Tco_1084710 [Tanacetum coccineum]